MFFHPVTVGNFAFLFNCTTVSRSADSVTAPSGGLEGWRLTVNVCGWAHRGLVEVFLCSCFRSPSSPTLCFIIGFVIMCVSLMFH